jgi:hypothetical protein
VNAKEIGKLLGFAALYDSRKVDVPDVLAWHKVIGDLSYAEAEAAVSAHYTESTDRIMPAHIRQRVKAARRDRLDRHPIEAPATGDQAAYRTALKAEIRRIADGFNKPIRDVTDKAIEDGMRKQRPYIGKPARRAGRLDPAELAARQSAQSRRERDERDSHTSNLKPEIEGSQLPNPDEAAS